MTRSYMRTVAWCAVCAAICFAVIAHTGPILHGLMWFACAVCAFFSLFFGLMFALIREPR